MTQPNNTVQGVLAYITCLSILSHCDGKRTASMLGVDVSPLGADKGEVWWGKARQAKTNWRDAADLGGLDRSWATLGAFFLVLGRSRAVLVLCSNLAYNLARFYSDFKRFLNGFLDCEYIL